MPDLLYPEIETATTKYYYFLTRNRPLVNVSVPTVLVVSFVRTRNFAW
jgi:hypothetical protein